jgi:hypothetical protein
MKNTYTVINSFDNPMVGTHLRGEIVELEDSENLQNLISEGALIEGNYDLSREEQIKARVMQDIDYQRAMERQAQEKAARQQLDLEQQQLRNQIMNEVQAQMQPPVERDTNPQPMPPILNEEFAMENKPLAKQIKKAID